MTKSSTYAISDSELVADRVAEVELVLAVQHDEYAVDEVQTAFEIWKDMELLQVDEVLRLKLMMLAMNLMMVDWSLPQLVKP